MAWLLSEFGGYLAAAGGAVALLIGVWLKGHRTGRAEQQAEQDRHRTEAIAAKRKSDSEIDDLAPADRDQRFDRWVRR
ncbi:hypothetical protein [Bosea sp. (in: a-proteobacteria)]|uniref:hypothetical protein n=1 Tax=Bosea sp. (in: a-proteobacteria) TaxID=1871050 RepID=UPI003B3AF6AC